MRRPLRQSTTMPAAILTTAILTSVILPAAGCGEPAPEPVAPPSRPGASSQPPSPAGTGQGGRTAPGVTAITVKIAQGRVETSGRRVKVARGSTVRITVTSDVADEFHLHGYDRTLKLTPGKPATLELKADVPGVFEAELHGLGTRLFELQVG